MFRKVPVRPSARRRRGVLAFEWILLITLLVIGIIGGLSAVRDAIVLELKDLATCVQSLNVCHHPCDDDDDPPCVCDVTDPNCCLNQGP